MKPKDLAFIYMCSTPIIVIGFMFGFWVGVFVLAAVYLAISEIKMTP